MDFYTISLGCWSLSSGRVFVHERIYYKGYKWTPFCKISWRYTKAQNKLKRLKLKLREVEYK